MKFGIGRICLVFLVFDIRFGAVLHFDTTPGGQRNQ